MPLGPSFLEPARGAAGLTQPADRVMGHDAEGPAAVGDHLAALGQLIKVLLELVDRDRSSALDVAGLEFVARGGRR